MNRTILTGRQTDTAKVSYMTDGTCVARFTLTVDRRGSDKADFPSCVAFGKTGEFIEKYGAKGKKWNVEGRIQTGAYEKDGHRVYTTDVIVENVEFGESKNSESSAPTANANDLDQFITVYDSEFDEVPFLK